jgi:peptide deformylase
MIRPILRHGVPSLHEPAEPVAAITPDIHRLIDDMIETMHKAPGVGLAAPQVGVAQRVFVIDLSMGARPADLVVLINPQFTERIGLQLEDEGCLSLPGLTAVVPRPERAVVRGLNRDAVEHAVEGTGLLARALQHEMDHLNGRLYIDRLNPVRRWVMMKRVAALKARGRW